jgi:hypothetical protein
MKESSLLEFHRTAVEVVDWDHMSWQAIEGRSNKWNGDNLGKDYFHSDAIDTYGGRNLTRENKINQNVIHN